MSSVAKNRAAWRRIQKRARSNRKGGAMRIPKGAVPHPRDAGARATATWPAGQVADYSLEPVGSSAPLTVREYEHHWDVFVDSAEATVRLLRVVERDPSSAMYVGGALLGAALGTSVSGKKEGMLVGAGLGLLLIALLECGRES
jgi:hypothetical protein